jgi:outer membrane protein OmpA-like peptidoglycan-associated protein
LSSVKQLPQAQAAVSSAQANYAAGGFGANAIGMGDVVKSIAGDFTKSMLQYRLFMRALEDVGKAYKELKNIAADISFDTGSSVISTEGKKLITGILDSIKTDIQSWRKYLDNHDENVFSNEDYSTILIISGYSDTQGSGDEKTRVERNLALSEARAKAVAAEFEKQLKALDVKWKLSFKISYEGKGEVLPPAITDDKQKNNPNRRVTTIRMVVGPKILLYNNGE